MLQRMRCFLGVMAAADGGHVNSTRMEACKTTIHSTNFLNLAYPMLPQKRSCSREKEKPCTPEFLTTYDALKAPATDCTACASGSAGGGVTDVPSPDVGGVESNDDMSASSVTDVPSSDGGGGDDTSASVTDVWHSQW